MYTNPVKIFYYYAILDSRLFACTGLVRICVDHGYLAPHGLFAGMTEW